MQMTQIENPYLRKNPARGGIQNGVQFEINGR